MRVNIEPEASGEGVANLAGQASDSSASGLLIKALQW